MKRGEIWWINFDPSVGGEIQKRRPAIIISNDSSNKHLNRLQVIPLSSQVQKVYPCECLLVINGQKLKALADQITTVSKTRIGQFYGNITREQMLKIKQIIFLQLVLLSE
jgi:mRNA interferase MazF